MILVGGANIYPAEIEAELEAHPAVRSAVVVGIQDDDLGNLLHAVVYTGQDHVTPEELTSFLRGRLARSKVPSGYSFADHHLRGEDGKVRRSDVAAWVARNAV